MGCSLLGTLKYNFLTFLICLMPAFLLAQKWDTLATIPASFTFPVVVAVDGEIHVMGGGGEGGATTLHYAYDPEADMWERKADVPYAAQQPAGAATDEKIHFFGGGFPNSGTPLDDHYIYDVANDTWEEGGKLTAPRAIHNAVAIDGAVYSVGGQGMQRLFQRYNEDTKVWEDRSNLPDNQFWYGAHITAKDGKYYRFCGGGYTSPVNQANVYDPATNSWSALPSFPDATHGLKGAVIGDKIFLTGGYHSFEERSEMLIFDTETDQYTLSNTPLPIGRNYHGMVSIDSCIYVVGGNHAIESIRDVIRTQLIRICPSEMTSDITDQYVAEPLTVSYFDENIILQLPEDIESNMQFELYDMMGKQVFSQALSNDATGTQTVGVGALSSSVYVAIVKSGHRVFSSKLFIH